MKTLKTLSLIALVTVVILSACNSPKVETAQTAATAMPLLKDTVDTTTAKRLVSNFNPRSAKVRSGGLLVSDTRCVWFSIKQLKALINRVDSVEKGDGIRFYFATYDKNLTKGTERVRKEYRDYSTLVMVSTKKDSLRDADTIRYIHADYYTAPKKLLKGKYVLDAKHAGVIITAVPENQGELCPPPARCKTEGATLLP